LNSSELEESCQFASVFNLGFHNLLQIFFKYSSRIPFLRFSTDFTVKDNSFATLAAKESFYQALSQVIRQLVSWRLR
jgi:hypothetical protein